MDSILNTFGRYFLAKNSSILRMFYF